ncbi:MULTISPECIES: TetR/AcrR family transcriptional regulator [Corallococcus]|uniref:TetR/AcrR family transcriptional regulator n=1 Tax=Corallococcus TaxID=83461 RepID=UPI00117CC2DE|nr:MULTISPECIES: TetR/AcrR family transcriptional regulator [Corallococcus]NBD08445.1 TetR family transcriptional regulator [Corallococcus silvisoli]TSC34390.1 TetR/AcrR family transcriptional regulator [Corallococcus sp. Z5C101001]
MKNDPAPKPRPRGRPREFDETKALDAALEVFWRQGFEGASLTDLTQAMGITPPSLYAAFGSKAELYQRTLERYQAGPGALAWAALAEEPTAREAIARVLQDSARSFKRRKQPPGCMISTAVLRCADELRPIAEFVTSLRENAVGRFHERIARGIEEGELPSDTDARVLARYYGAVLQGMSVQALDGASEAELLGLAELAMRAWGEGGGRRRAR